MDFIQPIVLGVVQGLAEFLPVSSSGHLVIVREIFGFEDQGALFDAVLHLATVIAILIYFRADWANIISSLNPRSNNHSAIQSRRILWLLVLSTLPAIAGGLLFPQLFTEQGRTLTMIASLMVFTGLMFIVVERVSRGKKNLSKLTFFDALSLGVAQLGAMLPGISRSGATIATGLYIGLKREEAARYAFLLGVPALVLAGGYALLKMEFGQVVVNWAELGIGFAVSLVSSIVAIAMMMRFVRTHKLHAFSVYLIALGLLLISLKIAHIGLPLFQL